MSSLQLSKHYLTKHCSRNVLICVVWVIHLWVSLLMTCRVSITDLRMMRMVNMGVDYHLFQWDQQAVRRHGSICSHSSHFCSRLSSSNALLIHLYHLHALPDLPVYFLLCAVVHLARHQDILLHQVLIMTLISSIVRRNNGNISGSRIFGDKAWRKEKLKKHSDTIVPVVMNH